MEIFTRFSFAKNINFCQCLVLENLSQFRIKTLLLVSLFLSSFILSAQEDVTTIYGDQGGFFVSSTASPIMATDSNNLLGFMANGVTYSTGVDDSVLTSNGITTFTAAEFQAFPVPGNITYSATELIGVAYNWGGTIQNNAVTDYIKSYNPIVPSSFIRDGINGLELSTNFFNIDAQDFIYDNLSINLIGSINDGIPDIIATQTGDPSGSDTFKFVDSFGNTVGSSVLVNFSSVDVVGSINWTIYNVNSSTGTVTGLFGSNTPRDLRLLTFELSDFGITSANAAQITDFIHTTSGNTDIAFTAFNTNSLIFSSVDLSIDSSIVSAAPLCTTTALDFVSTITNNSTTDSSGFEVDGILPSSVTYSSSASVFSSGTSTATYNSTYNKWIISGLDAGESVTLTISGSVSSLTLPVIYNAGITNMTQSDTDTSNNLSSVTENDNDCDGVFDSIDEDDDNDGILDLDEGLSVNIPTGDSDGDGILNYLDVIDNGGLGDGSATDYTDLDGNNIPDVFDIDGDGVPNHFDLDTDNDGIYDVDEAGGTDNNDDGLSDGLVNINGVPATAASGLNPIDTLGDGSFDFQNTDSDLDGCSDANEAYDDNNADGGDGGQFGLGDPATVDLTNGLIAGLDYTNGTNATVIDDSVSSGCSLCIDDIPAGNPTAAIDAGDVTFDIDSGISAGFPAELNSITIAGEPNPFTAIYAPNNLNYQYANPAAGSQYVRDQLSTTASIADGPVIYNAALLAANAENDLRHYLSMDNTIDPTDYNEYIYNSPIAFANTIFPVGFKELSKA